MCTRWAPDVNSAVYQTVIFYLWHVSIVLYDAEYSLSARTIQVITPCLCVIWVQSSKLNPRGYCLTHLAHWSLHANYPCSHMAIMILLTWTDSRHHFRIGLWRLSAKVCYRQTDTDLKRASIHSARRLSATQTALRGISRLTAGHFPHDL